MKVFFATNDTNLKDFTDAVYPQGSFCFGVLLKGKDIKVNGVRTNKNIALKEGDEVVYYTTKKQEEKLSHTVVFEDSNILIADKFSGVSLLSELNGNGTFYAVHRLDRNTQGLISYAKTRQAEEELLSAFKEKKVAKTYVAICKNNFEIKEATLTLKRTKEKGLSEFFLHRSPIP